jgi:CRISPR-associated protein Csb2
MPASWLCVSMRFLDTQFHGRRDGAKPEWPPSPLRLLQSLVTVTGRLEPQGFSTLTKEALIWLEERDPPIIVAPKAKPMTGRRLSVPNNAMDVVAKAWSRGNDTEKGDANPRTHRTMKAVRPLWLEGECASFVWDIGSDATSVAAYVERLTQLARRVPAFGWGVDVVVGNASLLNTAEVEALVGERWGPGELDSVDGLRVPVPGTLEELVSRYAAFTRRVGREGFFAPPTLSKYRLVSYRRATDPLPRPHATYSLSRVDKDGFRAFDTVRKALTVAGMARHATKLVAEASGWDEAKVARFVLGHAEKHNEQHAPPGAQRFAYLPLPSIEPRGQSGQVVGRVRRVMLTTFASDTSAELAWARLALTAQELVDERTGKAVALLSLLSTDDTVVRNYTRQSSTWSTVTPMVLPGFDDPDHLRRKAQAKDLTAGEKRKLYQRLSDRTDGLVRKAMKQCGFPQELAEHATVECRKVGFRAGVDHADRFGIPDHIKRFPRYHVRIQFRDRHGDLLEVPGPICLGAGRFLGVGLFVAE